MQNVYERAKKKKDESCIFLSPLSLSLGMTNETFLEFADFFFFLLSSGGFFSNFCSFPLPF